MPSISSSIPFKQVKQRRNPFAKRPRLSIVFCIAFLFTSLCFIQIDQTISTSGYVTNLQTSLLDSPRSGEIESYFVEVGEEVEFGQTLAELTTENLRQEWAEIDAKLMEEINVLHVVQKAQILSNLPVENISFPEGHHNTTVRDLARAYDQFDQKRISALNDINEHEFNLERLNRAASDASNNIKDISEHTAGLIALQQAQIISQRSINLHEEKRQEEIHTERNLLRKIRSNEEALIRIKHMANELAHSYRDRVWTTLEQTQSNIKALSSRQETLNNLISNSYIVAKRSGVVHKISTASKFEPGAPVIEVSSPSDTLQILAIVAADDVDKLMKGQSALISWGDSRNVLKSKITASISYVSPFQSRPMKYLERHNQVLLKTDMALNAQSIKNNQSADVRIVIGTKSLWDLTLSAIIKKIG